MKHYKDSNNNVYAYEADGSQDAFILPGLTRITDAEADALRSPPSVTVVPQTVTRFQARAALSRAGLFVTVNDMMMALPVDNEQRLAWTDALSFERTSPTLASLATVLGLTSQDLDGLFTVAAGIEA